MCVLSMICFLIIYLCMFVDSNFFLNECTFIDTYSITNRFVVKLFSNNNSTNFATYMYILYKSLEKLMIELIMK